MNTTKGKMFTELRMAKLKASKRKLHVYSVGVDKQRRIVYFVGHCLAQANRVRKTRKTVFATLVT